ncbi:hypothetical protein [Nocardia sp. BMG111209]|uniref:hypothetical protein n=1 Tax=Nocardia sp. BMG111209 TaxID=1160137 RepID=UPI00036438E1|nr:hypothetical protein [Nocardia sp. BMG111209]
MNTFPLAGADTSALTHFALYGLANITESETGHLVQLRWNPDTRTAELHSTATTQEDIARTVHAHATRCAADGSWLHARVDHGGRAGTAAFSPRIKLAESDEEWRALQQVRHAHLDTLLAEDAHLDLTMIGCLGEPSYWRFEGKDRRPDHGASRWEMKARNKGQEFVNDRLLPMAKTVAARTPDAILRGLLGHTVTDELGNDKPDSQTSTGFTRPAPTDCALAWCALWGITNFPIAQRISVISRTPSAFPARVLHPTAMALPLITEPTTTARLRTLLTSSALDLYAEHLIRHPDTPTTTTEAAGKWLTARHVTALILFPIQKVGSDAAPQRFVLDGRVEPLPTVTGSLTPFTG